MSNPNQLFLLADHVKLSLLERQRAQTLNLDAADSKDGHISRSLDQFRDGLEALQREQARLEEAGDEEYAPSCSHYHTMHATYASIQHETRKIHTYLYSLQHTTNSDLPPPVARSR